MLDVVQFTADSARRYLFQPIIPIHRDGIRRELLEAHFSQRRSENLCQLIAFNLVTAISGTDFSEVAFQNVSQRGAFEIPDLARWPRRGPSRVLLACPRYRFGMAGECSADCCKAFATNLNAVTVLSLGDGCQRKCPCFRSL